MKASRSATEGTVGLITYMRTDSTARVAGCDAEAREYVSKQAGRAVSAGERRMSTRARRDAQDAHEAIRPTERRVHAGVDSRSI